MLKIASLGLENAYFAWSSLVFHGVFRGFVIFGCRRRTSSAPASARRGTMARELMLVRWARHRHCSRRRTSRSWSRAAGTCFQPRNRVKR